VDASRERAKKLVEFWNRRGWVTDGAPLHVHPLDLVKLEELIARELALDENRAPGKAAV
jgi:hypothetical protein